MADVAPRHHASATRSVRDCCAVVSPTSVTDQGSQRGSATLTEAREPPSALCHVLDAACTKHSPHARSLDIRALEGYALCKFALPEQSRSFSFTPRVSAPCAALDTRLRRRRKAGTFRACFAPAGLSLAPQGIALDGRPPRPGVERRCRGVDARAD